MKCAQNDCPEFFEGEEPQQEGWTRLSVKLDSPPFLWICPSCAVEVGLSGEFIPGDGVEFTITNVDESKKVTLVKTGERKIQ